jgi:hypothetical protein
MAALAIFHLVVQNIPAQNLSIHAGFEALLADEWGMLLFVNVEAAE